MAVEAREALNEGDSSDTQAGYNEEEEEEEEEEGGGDYSRGGELHELRRRIAQSSYGPLSEEAVEVLYTALLSLHDPSMSPPPSSLSPLLLHELRSLKTLIPPSQGDKGSTSCVITQALNYLEQLNTILKGLKEGMQESTRDTLKDDMSPTEGHSFTNVVGEKIDNNGI